MAKHPYCRTCGSKINSSPVCPFCGCEPLKGNSFCCDCGSATLPQAIMCVHCGTTFHKKFSAVLAALLVTALVVAIGGTAYFIYQNTRHQEQVADTGTEINDSLEKFSPNPSKNNEIPNKVISNNILIKPEKKNLIGTITKNIPPIKKGIEVKIPNPKSIEKTRPNPDVTVITPAKGNLSTFSGSELRGYPVICSYSLGHSRNNAVFFTTSVFGYLKMNGRIYELQGVEKGNDIARFSGTVYDVSIEIEGLAGNESLWMASCTMIIKDKTRRAYSRYTVYSSCTEF